MRNRLRTSASASSKESHGLMHEDLNARLCPLWRASWPGTRPELHRQHQRTCGYRIADLVERGTFAQVAELLWTGSWPAHFPCPRSLCPMQCSSPCACRGTRTPWTPCARCRSSPPATDGMAAHRAARLLTAFAAPRPWRPSPVFGTARNPSTRPLSSRLPRGSCSSSPDRTRPGPSRLWMPTSSWRPSTASTPQLRRPGYRLDPLRTVSRCAAPCGLLGAPCRGGARPRWSAKLAEISAPRRRA